ncbi:Methyltransferase domain-containing protein [Nonlabens sp. Hel1_33_55]|uniref:class I SAM-dependent methyltransferase n=1 Tax=Nonlabens sp. Hel1_33_55 TaxID=1336802 RepID=UPI000875CE7F|nr:class I SAM-dependent methyltransferase [Nonlabens sp. Hel1_33_55]SCY04397.1 Methyltransferase domain-containing protein [Nonlabens sp. Hel1_33_55]
MKLEKSRKVESYIAFAKARTFTILALFFIFMAPLQSCNSQKKEAESVENNEVYTYKSGDYNGIGKWYLGREIAHVMGFQGMEWLNRPEREQEENVSTLLENMEIESDDVIADIGAGSGYHVFKMAPKASKGKVYAVDIQEEMLAEMKRQKELRKTTNVELIKGSEQSVNLPEDTIDKVLMVDVYHEFNYPLEMMLSIKKSLKPDGKVYLIEYRGEDPAIPIKTIHKMTEAQSVKEMEAAGFSLVENIDNLPWQHCMVFSLK